MGEKKRNIMRIKEEKEKEAGTGQGSEEQNVMGKDEKQ